MINVFRAKTLIATLISSACCQVGLARRDSKIINHHIFSACGAPKIKHRGIYKRQADVHVTYVSYIVIEHIRSST